MRDEKGCILIIDDDYINCAIMENVFADDYIFILEHDGESGLNTALSREEDICAVLLDVNMPKMTGIEVILEFAKHRFTDRVPVFLVTSHDEHEIVREAYDLGVMDVINKPIVPFVIKRRVQSVVELYRARKAQEKKLDIIHRTTIESLASAIEFRDVDSGEHSNRIYGITKHILEKTEMGEGFSRSDIENMAIGSIMHDVGKIAVSDLILNKPGKLTNEEYDIMKQHTVYGYELMEQIYKAQRHDCYKYACDIARHHHERWDGRGYPDGLCGDEISAWSQVVSMADVYDALVSPRVYRPAFHPDVAVQMILDGKCGSFNPKLIKCFLEVEPELRALYTGDTADTATEPKRGGNGIINVLLLRSAIESVCDLVLTADLTENTYNVVSKDKYLVDMNKSEGIFDDLIVGCLAIMPDSHKQIFFDTFSRESLLRAFAEGKNTVVLRSPQYTRSGDTRMAETRVMLMRDAQTGDIMSTILVTYIND